MMIGLFGFRMRRFPSHMPGFSRHDANVGTREPSFGRRLNTLLAAEGSGISRWAVITSRDRLSDRLLLGDTLHSQGELAARQRRSKRATVTKLPHSVPSNRDCGAVHSMSCSTPSTHVARYFKAFQVDQNQTIRDFVLHLYDPRLLYAIVVCRLFKDTNVMLIIVLQTVSSAFSTTNNHDHPSPPPARPDPPRRDVQNHSQRPESSPQRLPRRTDGPILLLDDALPAQSPQTRTPSHPSSNGHIGQQHPPKKSWACCDHGSLRSTPIQGSTRCPPSREQRSALQLYRRMGVRSLDMQDLPASGFFWGRAVSWSSPACKCFWTGFEFVE